MGEVVFITVCLFSVLFVFHFLILLFSDVICIPISY